MVFCCLTSDVSPEFSAWLKEAVNTTTAGAVGLSHTPDPPSSSHRLVTLVLNSSPLPPALQGHRSFSASSSELLEMSQGQGSRSEVGVLAACKLFCDLIGLQMQLNGEDMKGRRDK